MERLLVTAVDVDALDKLREAATAGPWDHHCCIVGADSGAVAQTFLARDGDLIVGAVNALPDLIATVREVAQLLDAADRNCALLRRSDLRHALRRVVAAVDGGEQ